MEIINYNSCIVIPGGEGWTVKDNAGKPFNPPHQKYYLYRHQYPTCKDINGHDALKLL